MKKLMLLMIICPFLTFAQSEIPAAAKQAFVSLYPDVKGENWEKDEAGYYKVMFVSDSIPTQLSITPSGKVYQKRMEIPGSELPRIILEEVEELFPGKKLFRAYYYIKSDGRSSYSVWMEGEAEEYFFTWDN